MCLIIGLIVFINAINVSSWVREMKKIKNVLSSFSEVEDAKGY